MRTQAGQHLCKEAGVATGPVAVPVRSGCARPSTRCHLPFSPAFFPATRICSGASVQHLTPS